MQARWFPPYVVPKRPTLGLIFEFIKIPPTGNPFPIPLAMVIISGSILLN